MCALLSSPCFMIGSMVCTIFFVGNGPAPQIVSLDTRSLEAAQSEARVAWERAREMAGKAVKLVKLAQEGGASESVSIYAVGVWMLFIINSCCMYCIVF